MADKILKFTRDNELVGQADAVRPGLVALDPDGSSLYAGRSMMSVSPPESMVQLDREEMAVEEIELLMPRPHALAVSDNGALVYVSSLALNRVGTFMNDSGDLRFSDVEGDRPHVFIGFTISPDGTTMVGTTEVTSQAFVFDLTDGDVAVADTIGVLRAPWHPIYSTDGKWVYFGNNWTNTITVLDLENRSVAKVIRGNGLAQPHGSAASPDGRYIYISNRNLAMPEGHSKQDHVYHPRYDLGDNAHIGTVLVLDTQTQEIVKIIETEEYASGMGTARIPR
jgi:DNA-binding beta-propeller fold protein YncE